MFAVLNCMLCGFIAFVIVVGATGVLVHARNSFGEKRRQSKS